MARITGFERITKDRPTIQGVTRCTYFSFEGPDGRQYFTLETYGSQAREYPGKVSQALQFDEDAAAKLIDLIRQVFPNLR